ncbi:MAG: ABC transporter ATP-binding protein [Chloroflexi bacterium]|nr:ABC transporter ATP-binding protein [Chloroflexota bacterium]
MTSGRPILEIKDLVTRFYIPDGVVRAVDGVSYTVHEGEMVGIVGESGCGKSVTALSVMRLIPYPPGRVERGEILLEGEDILKMSNDEMLNIRGSKLSMIFQEPMTSLNPVLTIGRQMTEALESHMGMDKVSARGRAAELLDMVGIPDGKNRLGDYPHQFSGGMRQRVMIAMGISCDPKVLIADEPTTALDVTIQAQILELIQRLNRELGTAVIIITHNLGVVARYADWVNVMYAGRIIESGPAGEIYKNPQHPYTLGLLSSVPRLDEPRELKLVPIEGMPPDLSHLPDGCHFRARCRFAIDRCATEYPPFEAVEGTTDHHKACFVDVNTHPARETYAAR